MMHLLSSVMRSRNGALNLPGPPSGRGREIDVPTTKSRKLGVSERDNRICSSYDLLVKALEDRCGGLVVSLPEAGDNDRDASGEERTRKADGTLAARPRTRCR